MVIEWNWTTGLINYFKQLIDAIDMTIPKFQQKTRAELLRESLTIRDLAEKLQHGELRTGDIIRIKGVYSEFIPLLNIRFLFPSVVPLRPPSEYVMHTRVPFAHTPEFAFPLRLKPIRNIGLAGLFETNCKGVYDNCIPVFYQRPLKSQRNTSGKIVEIEAKVINLPSKWIRLFVPHDVIEYNVGNTKTARYVGLFMRKVEMRRAANKFFVDLWRLDHFPFRSFEEEQYEFYHGPHLDFEDWPNAYRNIMDYLGFLFHEVIKTRQIASLGIIPRINAANHAEINKARRNLRNFYFYAYKHRWTNGWSSGFSVGHGVFDTSYYRRATTVFQYDQVNPVLKQKWTVDRIVREVGPR